MSECEADTGLATEQAILHMRRRGLTDGDMAAKCGCTEDTFANQRTKRFPSHLLRLRIEAAFDFTPIWSTRAQIDFRRRCLAVTGCDPVSLEGPEVEGLCRRLGVRIPANRNRPGWLFALDAFFAARPKLGLPQASAAAPDAAPALASRGAE